MILSVFHGVSLLITEGEAILETEKEASLIELPEFVRDAIKIAYRIYRSSKIELSATLLDSCPLIR